jgi:hypothetical protein
MKLMTDQLSKADIVFDRVIDLANSRIGKTIVYGAAIVACLYFSGHLMHILAGFVIGFKTFAAAIRNPI